MPCPSKARCTLLLSALLFSPFLDLSPWPRMCGHVVSSLCITHENLSACGVLLVHKTCVDTIRKFICSIFHFWNAHRSFFNSERFKFFSVLHLKYNPDSYLPCKNVSFLKGKRPSKRKILWSYSPYLAGIFNSFILRHNVGRLILRI